MPIPVICPGCKASFRVSDKFAGKTGPCPKCKTTIKIPEAVPQTEQVIIKGGEEFAGSGKDSQGRPTAKPIPRRVRKLSKPVAAGLVVGGLLSLVGAWLLGRMFPDAAFLKVLGLLAVTPPACWLLYHMQQREDLDYIHGRNLWMRTGLCSLAYVGLWIAFRNIPPELMTEAWQWLYLAPPLVIVGALVALGCYDLDFGGGMVHYAGYLLFTGVLAVAAGTQLLPAGTGARPAPPDAGSEMQFSSRLEPGEAAGRAPATSLPLPAPFAPSLPIPSAAA